ncbi:MAG: glycosyltransferase family 39 protein [Anaerolineae bacterium]
MKRRLTRMTLVMCAVTLLAFGLRVTHLDAQGLWSDEFLSLGRAAMPPGELVGNLPVEHVPLYFWLLHFWTLAAGSSDFALRFVSALFGALAVPLLYALGRRLVAPAVALLGALLLAINPFQIWYSQEARMYTMLAALGLLAWLALDVALTEPRRRLRAAVVYVAACVAAMYAHDYGALIPLLGLLWAVTRLVGRPQQWRTQARRLLLTNAAIAVLCVPWLARASHIREYTSPLPPSSANPLDYVAMLTFGTTLPDEAFTWLGLGAALLGLVGLAVLFRSARARREYAAFALAVMAVAVPLVIAALLLWRGSVFHPRYFIMAAPVYCLILAQAALALNRRSLVFGAAAAVFLVAGAGYSLSLWYGDDHYAKSVDKEYMTLIEENSPSDAAILADGPRLSTLERYGSDEFDSVINLRGRVRQQGTAAMIEAVAEAARSDSLVWLITRPPDESDEVKAWLDTHGFQAMRQEFDNYTVYAYSFPRATASPAPPAAVNAHAPVSLTWAAAPNPAKPEDVVNVDLNWLPHGPLPADSKVSLRLYDADGNLAWQRDREPDDGTLSTQDWRPGDVVEDRLALGVPGDLAPGVYTLRVVLYDPRYQQELLSATLGTFRVAP